MATMNNAGAQRLEIDLEDGVLAGLHWPAAGRPPLLFIHATGFCASAYRQMLSRLAGRFDVTALDMRGHGRTRLNADPGRLRSWTTYAGDVGAFLDRDGRRGWTLAGHSMGAIVSALAAEGRADVAALRLIEPVLPPDWVRVAAATPLWPHVVSRGLPMVRGALRRRDGWPDRAAAKAGYAARPVFAGWADGVLDDYLDDGLVERDDGVRLACAPAWEAATFAAQANPSWRALARLRSSAKVFVADHAGSTVPPAARRRLKKLGVALTAAGGVSHLAPMERPDMGADFIAG